MNRFRKQNNEEKASEPTPSPSPSPSTPLREYEDGPPGLPPSMQFFRFEVTAYWLLPLVIFCAILFGGIYVAIKFDFVTLSSGDSMPVAPYIGPGGDILVPELLASSLAAVGGREALEAIRSIRYKGRVVEESGEINFQILVSLPDKGMIMVNPGEPYSQKLVLNGDTAWQVSMGADGERKFSSLGERDTASLAWSLRVHNTFRRLVLGGGSDGFSARKVEFLDRPCYELTKEMPDGSQFLAVLDAETLYLLKSVETTNTAGELEVLEILYDDYRTVSGIVEAYETKTYKEGKLYNQALLDHIEIDPGLMSSLFEVPEEFAK